MTAGKPDRVTQCIDCIFVLLILAMAMWLWFRREHLPAMLATCWLFTHLKLLVVEQHR